ncbi:MAG: hypothetical protein ACI9IA_002322 [Enterobacterales bacterium]|jgi:hypothetical protein
MSKKIIDSTLNELKKGFKKLLDSEPSDAQSNEYDDWNNESKDDNADYEEKSEFRFNKVISDKVKNVINDFIEAAPLIERAGFRIRDLEIELSVIPKLIPHFEKTIDVDDKARLLIIEEVHDKRLIRLLLKALFKADNFQKSIKMGNLEFSGIEIEITAIPAVRLRYTNSFEVDPSDDSNNINSGNDLV